MRARTVVATTSMWGHIDGLSRATEVSVRGKCGNYGWVPSGGKAPLDRWFLVRSVSASASSIGLSLLS